MKLLVVLSALLVATNALSDHEAWSEFKLTHSKQYQNVREEQIRFQTFQNNLKKIEEHNIKYDNGEVSYFFAVNQFADMTSEEFMETLNKQLASKPKRNGTRFEHEKYDEVPESVDWREKAVLAVKDQGKCGSCWAFSTTGSLEGQLALKKNIRTQLSEQELVDCDRKKNNGCHGGLEQDAFDYVRENGLSSEDSYKYTAKEGNCKKGTKVVETISGYKTVDYTENALKTAVGNIGPISIGIEANTEWHLYAGGIFDDSDCLGWINHGVIAVGYGTEGKDFWIVRNSWGTSWGEKGYIRLVRGKKMCGIQSDGSYPVL